VPSCDETSAPVDGFPGVTTETTTTAKAAPDPDGLRGPGTAALPESHKTVNQKERVPRDA